MNSKDLFDLEISETREPDLCFSSELDGISYNVQAWSVNDQVIVVLPEYGKFDALVKKLKPDLTADEHKDFVRIETCKCVQEAGRRLSTRGEKRVVNEY